MIRRVLILACLVTGCMYDSTPIVVIASNEHRQRAQEAFDRISEILVPVHMADPRSSQAGAMYLFIGPFDHPTRIGASPWYGGCKRLAWSATAHHATVTHEIGHMLIGAPHSDEPGNLMYAAGSSDPFVTEAQIERAEASARKLRRCKR